MRARAFISWNTEVEFKSLLSETELKRSLLILFAIALSLPVSAGRFTTAHRPTGGYLILLKDTVSRELFLPSPMISLQLMEAKFGS